MEGAGGESAGKGGAEAGSGQRLDRNEGEGNGGDLKRGSGWKAGDVGRGGKIDARSEIVCVED